MIDKLVPTLFFMQHSAQSIQDNVLQANDYRNDTIKSIYWNVRHYIKIKLMEQIKYLMR